MKTQTKIKIISIKSENGCTLTKYAMQARAQCKKFIMRIT